MSSIKKKSWKDDAADWVSDARKDPVVAAEMDAAAAARAGGAAFQRQLCEERAAAVAAAAAAVAWKKANPYVRKMVCVHPGKAAADERGWEIEPKYVWKMVPNV
jgi:hypothetical protein